MQVVGSAPGRPGPVQTLTRRVDAAYAVHGRGRRVTSDPLPPNVLRHISRGDSERLADLLLEMSDADRRALRPGLTAHVRTVEPWSPQAGPMLVAAAAGLPTAATVAAWVARRTLPSASRFHRTTTVAQQAVRVLIARDVPWYADLASRVAADLPAAGVDLDAWRFAADLIATSGAAIPTNDGFVIGWLTDVVAWSDQTM